MFGKPLALTRSGLSGTTPVSATRSYVYDAYQRLCKRVEPETGATLLHYDAANNIDWTESGSTLTSTATCDNANEPADAIAHTYDQRNRPLTESIPGSTGIAWSYFPDGAVQTLTSGSGATANVWTYAYDKRRLPMTEQLAIDGQIATITHTYNALGHESSLTYPDGLVLTTTPNALGQPTRANAYATGIDYFPNGGMSGFTYGNGIVHTLTQNARELPQESRDQAPAGAAVLDDSYGYDADANVAAISDGTPNSPNTRAMTYDALDRLTTTSAPNQPWIMAATTYDGLDNILTNYVGGRHYDYSYDGNNRLSQLSVHANGSVKMTLGYDANGNVTSKGNGNDSYVFDVANRMQSVPGKESYAYDGYGRRVKVTRLTDNLVDYPVYTTTGQLLTDTDQRSNTTTDYISLNGSLVAKRTAPIGKTTWTTTYEHTDALHSPIVETDASGNATRIERYTPFGEPSDGSYTQGPGFTGHVTDAATGLTYAQQRYYDPVIGRPLSVDPVEADPETGASFSRYAWVNDNPYKFSDPDGRCADTPTGAGSCGALAQSAGQNPDMMKPAAPFAIVAFGVIALPELELAAAAAETRIGTGIMGLAAKYGPQVGKAIGDKVKYLYVGAVTGHVAQTVLNDPDRSSAYVGAAVNEAMSDGMASPMSGDNNETEATMVIGILHDAFNIESNAIEDVIHKASSSDMGNSEGGHGSGAPGSSTEGASKGAVGAGGAESIGGYDNTNRGADSVCSAECTSTGGISIAP